MRQPEKLFPEFDLRFKEIRAICDLIRFYLSLETGFEGAIDLVGKNSHIITADEPTLEKWESLLHINVPPQDDLTYEEWLDERRQNIISAIGRGQRKTEPYLRQRLDDLMDGTPYELTVNKDGYSLFFDLDPEYYDKFDAALFIIEDVRPMNLKLYMGSSTEQEIPYGETITGSIQTNPPEQVIMKLPDEQSITDYMANLIAETFSSKAASARINGTIPATIASNTITGNEVSLIYTAEAGTAQFISTLEVLDSDGNVISKSEYDDWQYPLSRNIIINHRFVAVERNITGQGSYDIVWQNDDGTPANVPESTPTSAYPDEIIQLPTATREGYVFDGWTIGGTSYPAGYEFTMPNGPLVATAVYTQREVRLILSCPWEIYASNTSDIVIPRDATYAIGTIIDFSGWSFHDRFSKVIGGIYTDPQFTNEITNITLTEDTTLYVSVASAYNDMVGVQLGFQRSGVTLSNNFAMRRDTIRALFEITRPISNSNYSGTPCMPGWAQDPAPDDRGLARFNGYTVRDDNNDGVWDVIPNWSNNVQIQIIGQNTGFNQTVMINNTSQMVRVTGSNMTTVQVVNGTVRNVIHSLNNNVIDMRAFSSMYENSVQVYMQGTVTGVQVLNIS